MIVFSLSLLLSIFIIVTVIFYWVTYNKINDDKVYELEPATDEDTSIGYVKIKDNKNYSLDSTLIPFKDDVKTFYFQDE